MFAAASRLGVVMMTVASFFIPQPLIAEDMRIETEPFGKLDDGTAIQKFRLFNNSGNNVCVMEFGATLMDVNVPDRDGKLANVNLCFDNLQSYVDGHPYFGATVGRYANRIGGAEFTIDGVKYELTKNHGDNILHGGKQNFAFQPWRGESFETQDSVGVRFTLDSPAGDNGFPGNVRAICDYRWDNENQLTVHFTATSDAKTHLNLTNHSYFNLGGVNSGSVLGSVATIPSDQILNVDEDLIPTGKFVSVDDTPFDFRGGETLGKRIAQLPATKGYDHCYVVAGALDTGADPTVLRLAGKIVDPASGRFLQIRTTQPGVQLYTANHLGGGPANAGHSQHEAFCLETQHFPNTPNIDSFPSTLIGPGDELNETTVHRFGVE